MDMPVEHMRFIVRCAVKFNKGENAEVLHDISTIHSSFIPSLLEYCVAGMHSAARYSNVDEFADFIYNAVLSRITEICDVAEPF